MKPTVKAPGSDRLKLGYDILRSTFAFKFNLRRYMKGGDDAPELVETLTNMAVNIGRARCLTVCS
jgi:hypothetical protein